MIHLVTLSGNSKRFTDKGLPIKPLCKINDRTIMQTFIESFGDFHDYETFFVCRNQDLETTSLASEILEHCENTVNICGIDTNSRGPVYSIGQMYDKLPKDEDILISYIDTIQRATIEDMCDAFVGRDAGLTVHHFKNPHWRNNKSYCLVEHSGGNVTEVTEKFDFSEFDFSAENDTSAGSSGNYYFNSVEVMNAYFQYLSSAQVPLIRGEYYVTQAVQEMVRDQLDVVCKHFPYVSLGTPEDVADYEQWKNWFYHFDYYSHSTI